MTVDTATAVAALVAAKDVEALEAAISQASFLDSIPGDDRQKLRGGIELAGAVAIPEVSRPRAACCTLSFREKKSSAAARTRLKKLKAEEAAKSAAAADDAGKPVERSPHAKEVRPWHSYQRHKVARLHMDCCTADAVR